MGPGCQIEKSILQKQPDPLIFAQGIEFDIRTVSPIADSRYRDVRRIYKRTGAQCSVSHNHRAVRPLCAISYREGVQAKDVVRHSGNHFFGLGHNVERPARGINHRCTRYSNLRRQV